MTAPVYDLSIHGIGSTGEVTVTIIERMGAKRAGINPDASYREYPSRPVANATRRVAYPTLYAALAAAGDVIREEAWPSRIRVVLFKDGVGPDREALRDDALTRGRELIKDWDAGRLVIGEDAVRTVADLIARVEAAETRPK